MPHLLARACALACVLAGLGASSWAHAQTSPDETPAPIQALAATETTAATPVTAPVAAQPATTPAPPAAPAKLPIYVWGEKLTGKTEQNTIAEGDAQLTQGETTIHADRMNYEVATDIATADGNVRIEREGNIYKGSLLQLKVETFEGFFTDASYYLAITQGHGQASRVDFIDRDHSVIHKGNYTTCQRTDESTWHPDWMLRAESIEVDNVEQVGVARNAVLEFLGMPILPPIPYISFPLSSKRKSGLLPPTIGLDNLNGLEYTQPYYWNIAPNRDATLRSSIMTKRGVNLGGEFRYLEPRYNGNISGDVMPSDSLRDRMRWGYIAKHNATIDTGTPLGDVNLNVNVNRVSDDDYWRDFGRAAEPLRQRLLAGDAIVSWGQGDMSAQVRTLKWQTLQDPTAPIIPPFDRLPQIQWHYNPSSLGYGLDASVVVDTTRFHSTSALATQPNAQRTFSMAQVSRPFLAPGSFVTPRVQLHATQYNTDTAMSNGQRSASRMLPTVSLDSGLIFERDTRVLGRNLTQTLEPRAFYTYTPFRNQAALPVYDTAAQDFNFATIYTENAYGGNDRIADNNLLTMGVTTRLIDPETGIEAAQFGIAQRFRFSDQNVTLPGEAAVSERLSDLLLGTSLRWVPQWGFDSTVQYNPKTRRSIRSTIAANYHPGPYRTISAAYRLQRGTSEQVDVGWQWPLSALPGSSLASQALGTSGDSGRWYSVGRLNYSLQDRRFVDTVLGLEYDSCCWIGRVVLQRLKTNLSSANTRLLFQVEFVGFSRLSLGANPLETLRQHVPNYQSLRQSGVNPNRPPDLYSY